MRNIGKTDLILRAILVTILVILIATGILKGLAAIATEFFIAFQCLNFIIGRCYVYYYLGINTYKK